jgi:hypothetical protein
MATTIKLKSGSGAPLAGDLVAAEPAFDLTNKRLYTEDSGGTVIEVGTNPTSLTTGTFTSTGIDDNATSTAITIDSDGDVGIGLASPFFQAADRTAVTINGTTSSNLAFGVGGSANTYFLADSAGFTIGNTSATLPTMFYTNGSERMRIDSSGNVILNQSAGAADNTILRITGGTAGFSTLHLADTADINIGFVQYDHTNNALTFASNNAERMRIDSSGNVLVGITAGMTQGGGGPLQVYSTAGSQLILGKGTGAPSISFGSTTTQYGLIEGINGGGFTFYTGNGTVSNRLVITSSGNVGIGTASPSEKLEVSGSGATRAKVTSTGSSVQFIGSAASGGMYIDSVGVADNIIFRNTGSFTERMRIDSSGNLLVGKTSASTSTVGGEINSDGTLVGVRASGNPLLLNRTTTDGAIATFRKDNVTLGSIAVYSSAVIGINLRVSTDKSGFRGAASSIIPWYEGADRDNELDVGNASVRWDDIYATNGTIQTSDANEKQDIETLSEAETRVAVAAKGLLRKFRWKSAVEEKGDDARIHFGIIAQDLQAAFEAEGLDAGRYAMFIHSTWTDEETNEERSRMGVRYSELLAFIIAAI